MTTPRLEMPELAQSQSDPHLTINLALRRVDALLGFGVVTFQTETVPPEFPDEGDMHVIASSGATGAWLGKDDYISYRAGGIWEYVAPREGLLVFFEMVLYVYSAGSWQELIPVPP